MQQLRRARLAKEAGLPIDPFALPFPGNINVVNNSGGGMGLLGKFLLGVMMGVGLPVIGAGGALAVASLIKPTAALLRGPLEVDVPWKFDEGKMQFGKPQPVTPDLTIPVRE